MVKMVSRQTVISHLEYVPDEALDEILDFIHFVAARRRPSSGDPEFDSLQDSSTVAVWNSPEDEVWSNVPRR
jgi:hypothetical protein